MKKPVILVLAFVLAFMSTSCSITTNVGQDQNRQNQAESNPLGLRVLNSTRDAVTQLAINIINGEKVSIDVTNSSIPYYLTFTKEPSKIALIRDSEGEVIDEADIVYNEYEHIWQTANIYFKPGNNTIEFINLPYSIKKSMQKASGIFWNNPISSNACTFNGTLAFLSLGGWQSCVSYQGTGYNPSVTSEIRYNLWIDFSTSTPQNISSIKVKIINGPSHIIGNIYNATVESGVNGQTKYGFYRSVINISDDVRRPINNLYFY